ncbi:MAG: hypothetical protein ABL921_12575 [Pirellula sp.]
MIVSTLLGERRYMHARSQAPAAPAWERTVLEALPPASMSSTTPKQAEPAIHLVPRQSQGTRCWRLAKSVSVFRHFVLAIQIVLGSTVLLADEIKIPYRITVLDSETSMPVPLVELKTTSNMSWISDNAGVIAIDSPELMGREVWFNVKSHGYQLVADGFGYRGMRLTPQFNGEHRLIIQRTMVAERLGRLTGSGLLAESQKLGDYANWLESGVVGCDSVHSTIWNGKRFWIWGDTQIHSYPLGIFNTLGAESEALPVDLNHMPLQPKISFFRDRAGRVRGVVPFRDKGPIWLGGLVSLRDSAGMEHLVASYAKIEGYLQVVEYGLCEWQAGDQQFAHVAVIWQRGSSTPEKPENVHIPDGHAVRHVDSDGRKWILFANALPNLKIEDRYEAWKDPKTWIAVESPQVLKSHDGTSIKVHRGGLAWSDFRKSWITIFTQLGGKESNLGEIWYAESPTPFGPWSAAIKIATHDNYTIYNPAIHMEWSEPTSPFVYFEGTYTAEFAKQATRTARYDYNQILYRLRLDHPALISVKESK